MVWYLLNIRPIKKYYFFSHVIFRVFLCLIFDVMSLYIFNRRGNSFRLLIVCNGFVSTLVTISPGLVPNSPHSHFVFKAFGLKLVITKLAKLKTRTAVSKSVIANMAFFVSFFDRKPSIISCRCKRKK